VPAALGEPRVVLDFEKVRALGGYAAMPDGRLAVIQKGEDEDEVTRVNVVQNWFEELKAKVPTGK
ncbi:MAG: hypothetical protein ACE5E5_11185, partial [Phycisphaerae bacterium]